MSTEDSKDDPQVIPDEIRGLLEQRSTFQEWLGRLDDLGSEFRPEVSAKVRSDYTDRLRRVEAELEGHRTELEATLTDRRAAVAEVSERHEAHAAELEETELRHRVGEFDDEQWEARRREQQGALDELAADLSVHSSAVAALEAVLDELAGRPAPAAATRSGPEAEVATIEVVEMATVEKDAGEPVPRPELLEPPEFEDREIAPEPVADAWMTQPVSEGEPGLEPAVAEEEERSHGTGKEDVVTSPEPGGADVAGASVSEATDETVETEEPAEFMDELEFLESLSLDDADSFDAVSAMLDEEEEEESDRKAEDL